MAPTFFLEGVAAAVVDDVGEEVVEETLSVPEGPNVVVGCEPEAVGAGEEVRD